MVALGTCDAAAGGGGPKVDGSCVGWRRWLPSEFASLLDAAAGGGGQRAEGILIDFDGLCSQISHENVEKALQFRFIVSPERLILIDLHRNNVFWMVEEYYNALRCTSDVECSL